MLPPQVIRTCIISIDVCEISFVGRPNKESLCYGFHAKLDLPFDEAVERVMAALKQEGFGVLSDIDVRGAMKEKLGLDMPAYRIPGACQPAARAQGLTGRP